jgi:outer membrane protein assembly factor BamA
LQGKTYDPEKLDETYRELLRTGLFTNLRVSPTADGPEELRLDVTVQEAKAREVGFTIGAGSYEGFLAGIRLGDRNLFGNGRPLTLAIDYSQRGLKGELLYVDPWLFDTGFSLRARIFSAQRVEEGYSKEEVGWRFDLSRRVLSHLELAAFIEQASVSITEATIDESLLGPTSYFLSSVGLTGSVDYRDDPLNPSRGWIFTGALDFTTIDGEAAFTRFTTRLSYYVPIGKCLLAFGARAGLMKPVNDIAEIPIDERYFSGGATTVRSFAERELGPKDRSGDPIGGEFFTVFNTEFTFPIVGALRGAVFVDAGNLAASDAPGVDAMRYAVGAGLRYALPIGPLRLDYGLNPSPRADEDRGAFHFSFGFAF